MGITAEDSCWNISFSLLCVLEHVKSMWQVSVGLIVPSFVTLAQCSLRSPSHLGCCFWSSGRRSCQVSYMRSPRGREVCPLLSSCEPTGRRGEFYFGEFPYWKWFCLCVTPCTYLHGVAIQHIRIVRPAVAIYSICTEETKWWVGNHICYLLALVEF